MYIGWMFGPLIKRAIVPLQGARGSQFVAVSTPPQRVVFLGDSITDLGLWDEWLPDVPLVNRGVAGDSVGAVRGRLASAINEPLAVFLLIGTNDLSGLGESHRPEKIAEQFEQLLSEIRAETDAPLFVNSVMPRKAKLARTVRDLNRRLQPLATAAGATWIDLWPALADAEGGLRKNYTLDNTHLTGEGYQAWVDVLRPYLEQFRAGRQ